MIEKSAPAEVLAGQPYEYTYKVSNLTDATLENVMVSDRIGNNFATADSDPKAASLAGGMATWNLGMFTPKETKLITVKGSSAEEGVVTTCGWATYMPVVCQDIRVAKATSTQGVSAEATATTTIHQPVLGITCKATDQQFMGRKFDVSYTVANTGDAPADATKLEVAIPTGVDVAVAGNAQVNGRMLVWDLGSIAVSASQTVTATFTSATGGTLPLLARPGTPALKKSPPTVTPRWSASPPFCWKKPMIPIPWPSATPRPTRSKSPTRGRRTMPMCRSS
jgi:uncharacterized repeat protein (TIGR01451 family)